ncbi:MAG TPA: GAF and ANTAR domain-containing protein [Acidimicrobiales bacterium]|nr:GAF and ANTAR domain-containing protein [Acidimicrobiales bacterium]
MHSERSSILHRVLGDGTDELETKRLCRACVEIIGVTGAGIMLMSGDVPRGSLCTTNEISQAIEELQYTLGEGPCVDAYNLDTPIVESDLANPSTPRWVAFTPPAVEIGVRGIFGFPLQIGAVRLGALNLYCDQPGPLTDEQHAQAVVMAGVAAQAVLILQAGAPPGALAAELDASADFQLVVHQASGMVAAQLNVSVAHALIRLRAHAFGNSRTLTEVARAVVEKELRLDATNGEKDPLP